MFGRAGIKDLDLPSCRLEAGDFLPAPLREYADKLHGFFGTIILPALGSVNRKGNNGDPTQLNRYLDQGGPNHPLPLKKGKGISLRCMPLGIRSFHLRFRWVGIGDADNKMLTPIERLQSVVQMAGMKGLKAAMDHAVARAHIRCLSHAEREGKKWCVALGLRCEDSSHFGRDTRGGMGLGKAPAHCRVNVPARGPLQEERIRMQNEPGIPRRCSIFPGRAPHPPRPSRLWGAGAALVVLAAVLGIATPEDARAQMLPSSDIERDALAALYTATGGANWTSNDNWLDDDTELRYWHGVTTNDDGEVTQLTLRGNELSGSLPAKLGNLVNLTHLYLHQNALSGAIPPELGNLVNLTHLYLHQNALSGEIPMELGNLVNLTHLYLYQNTLSGAIPPDLGKLVNLTHLLLHQNALSGAIPPDLGKLVNLTYLLLRQNTLSGAIPTELEDLNELTQLHLQGNKLSGAIPPELGLSSLVDLKLHSNTALSGPLPANFPTAMPDLKALSVQNTGVTIPQTTAFTAWSARITSGTQTSDGVITLDTANTRPSGLWADSTTLYVVGEDGEKVYAYTLAGGVRAPAQDIPLDAANARPTGLWSDGTILWVLDYDDGKIYAYTLAGERDAAKDIESVPYGYGYGLWGRKDATCAGSDATCLLWLVRYISGPIDLRAYRIYADADATPAVIYGSANDKFNKILPTSDLLGMRGMPGMPRMPGIQTYERGLWWKVPEPDDDPSDDVATVWISDFFDARLYAYSANPRVEEDEADIVSAVEQDRILAPANLSPTAFWSDGTTWWVADFHAGKVFVYGSRASTGMPPDGDGDGGTTGGRTGRGGGGGGSGSSQDEHGNTPAQATLVTLDPTRTSSTAGRLNTAADVDYFSADVPHAGVLVVETSGSTATVGTVWQDEAELATANSGGVGQNFRLSARVAPGSVVIAVAGNGRQTGAYTLQVTFLPGYLENPGAESFQSGIGVISGWVCEAEEVEIVLNGEPQEAAYGTARLDTAGVCGDSDNGFGLLFNWNLLGDGEHEVVALVDGVELDRATVTVTTLGAEFLRDVTGTCTAADFPTMDETVTLAWQQTQQNFVIAEGAAPAGTTNRMGTPGVGYLENPGPNSFQSGIGVLSGWACEGTEVVIELNGQPQPAAYGTERLDTEEACGDTANGFGLLFNWNLLGEGAHEVVAFVDGEELGRATVQVTTLGAEFVRG